MDHDAVRVFMVLANRKWTWTPVIPRWRARDVCRDFAEGVEWEGERVIRALIVDMGLTG